MAFIEKKINGYRVSISGLSDTPSADGVSAAQLKALFDGRTDEEVLRAVNGLVDELLGPEAAAQIGERAGTVQQALDACVRSGDIRGIRVSGDNFIEITQDGQSWQAAGSGGHLVVDGQGNALPQRSRLRFENTEVRDRGGETVVSAVRGEKGEKGDPGPRGERGEQGFRGEAGKAWLPDVDSGGTLRFTLSDARTPPAPVSLRGPQGVPGAQGVQGAQGPAGPRGIQGEQGPAGPQGESAYRQACAAGYTGGEPAFSQSLSALPGHLGAEDNPHGVTAAQTGAFSRQESLLGSWQSGGAEAVWDWVACGGGRFVRLRAQSDAAQSSADGLRWTEERLPLPGSWIQPCCGAAGFVTLAAGRADAALSPDGRGWRQTALPCASQWEAVCFGGGYYVAVGSSPSALVFSRDGVLWQRAEGLPDDVPWSAVCHGAGRFVALSGTAESPARTAAFSLDGRRWQTAQLPRTAAWTAVRHGHEGFAALPAAGAQGARSPDGISWESFAVQDGEGFCALEYSGGLLLALPSGSADGLFASQNGQSWEKLPGADNWRMCRGGGYFVAVGALNGLGARSADGLTWEESAIPKSTWGDVLYDGKSYRAVTTCNKIAASSLDGLTWSYRQLPGAQQWRKMGYGAGKYVVVGDSAGFTLWSEDGLSWTRVPLPGGRVRKLKSVCWTGERFVAVEGGGENGVLLSTDGLGWREGTPLPGADGAESLCCGPRPMAVSAGRILIPRGALAAEEAVRAAVDGLSYALYGEHTGAAVTGTYTGNGVRAADADGGQRIALGFRPRAVLVRPQTVSSDGAGCLMAVREAPAVSDDGLALLSVTAYGFLAGEHRSTTRFVNADGAVYLYTAIR